MHVMITEEWGWIFVSCLISLIRCCSQSRRYIYRFTEKVLHSVHMQIHVHTLIHVHTYSSSMSKENQARIHSGDSGMWMNMRSPVPIPTQALSWPAQPIKARLALKKKRGRVPESWPSNQIFFDDGPVREKPDTGQLLAGFSHSEVVVMILIVCWPCWV